MAQLWHSYGSGRREDREDTESESETSFPLRRWRLWGGRTHIIVLLSMPITTNSESKSNTSAVHDCTAHRLSDGSPMAKPSAKMGSEWAQRALSSGKLGETQRAFTTLASEELALGSS